MNELDFTVSRLGTPTVPSPLNLSTLDGDYIANYTPGQARVMYEVDGSSDLFFEKAGPRQVNFFDGGRISAGIVTCGGLCPGMNNIVRGLVLTLWRAYGVRRILGFRYGYAGLVPDGVRPMSLEPEVVDEIHLHGGTVLGSSRGPQEPSEMVDYLVRKDVQILFTVGGDGTMRGAHAIAAELRRRQLDIALVGVPKTIDNDIPYVERTFGFETAVAKATEAIRAAWTEARSAPRGVGLVKLMGRHAGFIAAAATQAAGVADLVLIPEQPFELEHVVRHVRQRVDLEGHAVVVVAEGAGQRHLQEADLTDASGNKKLSDIGLFLKLVLKERVKGANLKYIDPSYIIRAAPANPHDAIFCSHLAEDAVHAGMAGCTDMVVGLWANRFTHVPLSAVTSASKVLDLDRTVWRSTVESTGQPKLLVG